MKVDRYDKNQRNGDISHGFGLGISTSMAIINAMKGKLSISSLTNCEDSGTKVTIKVPTHSEKSYDESKASKANKNKPEKKASPMFG